MTYNWYIKETIKLVMSAVNIVAVEEKELYSETLIGNYSTGKQKDYN